MAIKIKKELVHENNCFDLNINGTKENILFKAGDIANILDISNYRQQCKHFDDTEKVLLLHDTRGGKQKVLFLTINGVFKVISKNKKRISIVLYSWIKEIVNDISNIEIIENEEIIPKIENVIVKKEKIIKKDEKKINIEELKYIYIYNVDTRNDIPELKIGYTKNIKQRIISYTTVCTHGKCELCEAVPYVDINIVESYIHTLLHKYKIKREVFKLSIEKAKLIVLNLINLIKIVAIDDESEMDMKLIKIYEEHCRISNEIKNIFIESTKVNEKESKPNNFDEFIKKFCIVRPDVEINAKDIMGQYRLWSRNTKKEVTVAFKDYLDTQFKYTRLRNQGKDNTVYGYTGVTLIEIEHKRSLNPTDLEIFVFEKCVFSQGGTVLKSTLVEKYIEWKKNVDKEINKEEESELVNYFKNNQHVLYSTVWTKEGSGQGYYGLILKSDIKYYKKPSTTSKQVFKRLRESNVLLSKWDTIATAAESENVSNAKMSRYIKNNTQVNDYYYTLE